MKMFKRFAAALLVGVMALAMLTACGGSDSGLNEQTVENAMLTVYSELFGKEYTNNAAQEAQAKAFVNETVDDNGALKSGKATYKVVDQSAGTMLVLSVQDGKPQGLTAEDIKKLEDPAAVKAGAAQMKEALIQTMMGYFRDYYKQMGITPDEAQLRAYVEAGYDQLSKQVKAVSVGAVKKGNKVYSAAYLTMAAN